MVVTLAQFVHLLEPLSLWFSVRYHLLGIPRETPYRAADPTPIIVIIWSVKLTIIG